MERNAKFYRDWEEALEWQKECGHWNDGCSMDYPSNCIGNYFCKLMVKPTQDQVKERLERLGIPLAFSTTLEEAQEGVLND